MGTGSGSQVSITVTEEQWVETGGVRITKRAAPEGFEVSERDWTRWGDYLKELGQPVSAMHDAFLVSVGIAAGCAVATIAWAAEFSQIEKPSPVFIGAGVLLLALTLASAGVALVSRNQEDQLKAKIRRDADLLYADMDRVHAFAKDEVPPTA